MITAYVKVGISLHESVKEAKAMRGEKTDDLSSRNKVLTYVTYLTSVRLLLDNCYFFIFSLDSYFYVI